MSNETNFINDDFTPEEFIKLIKEKATKTEEDNKGNLIVTFGDTKHVLNYEQRNSKRFLKSFIMGLIILSVEIDFNRLTTRKLK